MNNIDYFKIVVALDNSLGFIFKFISINFDLLVFEVNFMETVDIEDIDVFIITVS